MSMLVNPFAVNAAGGGATDPYFSSVTVLCHFNGTDLSSTMTNEVSGGVYIVPSSGDARISTTQSVYNGSSLRIQNGAFVRGDPDVGTAAFNYGTGDFTIELLHRPDSTASSVEFFQMYPAGAGAGMEIYTNTTDVVYFVGADRINSGAGFLAANTWVAWAVSRASGTTRMFKNGIQVGSSYADTHNQDTNKMRLGNYSSGGYAATGYYAEFRITKGVGRYTGNYTVATAPFPNS